MAAFNSIQISEIQALQLFAKDFPSLEEGLVTIDLNRAGTFSTGNRSFHKEEFSVHHSQTSQTYFWDGNTHVIPRTIDFGTNPNQTLALDVICVQRAGASISMPLTSYSPVLSTPTLSSESLIYYQILSVDITLDLASGFSGAFDYNIPITGAANTLTLNVIGEVAARILQFRPDSNATEVWQYLTDIMLRVDGHEQRFSLRSEPRATLAYTFTTEGNLTTRMHSLMAAIYKQIVLAPLWFVFNLTTTAMTSATRSTVSVSTPDLPLAIGQQILLWESDTQYSVREISAFNATSITVTSPFQYDYPQKSLVIPTTRALLENVSVQLFNPQENYARFEAQLLVEEMPTQTYTNPYPSYNSDFVFTEDNVTRTAPYIVASFERSNHTVRVPTGRYVSEIDANPRLAMIIPFTVLCSSRLELLNMRRFVQFIRGSLRTFYISSMKDDLSFISSTTNASITCSAVLYANDQTFARDQLRHLEFEFSNGTIERREITAVSYDVTNSRETFTLDSALTPTFSATPITRISYLYYVRLADDNINFEYINPTNTFVQFDLLTLKEEN